MLTLIATLATEYLQTFTVFWCAHSCKIINKLALFDSIPEVWAADTVWLKTEFPDEEKSLSSIWEKSQKV